VAWWAANDSPTAPPSLAVTAPGTAHATETEAVADAAPLTTPHGRSYLVAEKLLERLSQLRNGDNTRAKEAVLTFKDAAALGRFLQRAKRKGFRVLGRIDRFNAVRISVDSYDDLAADLGEYAADFSNLGGNVLFSAPQPPQQEDRVAGTQVPVENGLLQFLGVTGSNSEWGRGVTIAVLDSGVAPDATFGEARVRYLDVGYGLSPMAEDGHGTAVASLAAGMSPDAIGVAPDAVILSMRVTAPDGLSDGFTLAQAIVTAVDNGARIVNISLGSPSSAEILMQAIDYATSLGAVLVASAGNDQAAQLTYPAADRRVISVGAVDALEQQVIFSNSGDQLQITAPGLGLQTAWLNGQRVLIDGTSASAPIVSGAIAAVMSQYPGLSAPQAWQIIHDRVSDGGPVGADPDYGSGILNLAWPMHWNDPGYVDPAISSHYLNPATGQMEFVVQNRSGVGLAGLKLDVTSAGNTSGYDIPWLAPGGLYVVRTPIDQNALLENGRIEFRTQLNVPGNVNDAVPANNVKSSSVSRRPSQ